MASIQPVGPFGHKVRFAEERFPLWRESFPDAVRQQMVEEDLMAGESVSLVLVSVITIGLILGIVSVICTW